MVKAVIEKMLSREQVGWKKYGTNLDRTDLSTLDWLTHLQEELMDATVYIEKLKTHVKDLETLAKSLGEKEGSSDDEANIVALFRSAIVLTNFITCLFIASGVVHHW